MDDRTKKWRQVFGFAEKSPEVGIYMPREFVGTRRGIIVGDLKTLEMLEEKVFEIKVDIGDDKVNFVTDSIEVLRTFSSRGFPLVTFARAIHHDSEMARSEMLFDGGWINEDDRLEMGPLCLRLIPTELNSYEVRMIK